MKKTTKHQRVNDSNGELEEKIIEDVKQSPQAFVAIYDRYVNQIYHYFLSHIGNSIEAQDLTSQVFLKALNGLATYRHRGHFTAWLFTIARHQWIDYYRQMRREVSLDDVVDLPSKENPSLETFSRDEIQVIRKMVHELPEDDQELIQLRFVAQLKFAEIAVILGCKEEAAKKRTYRLLARLENEMEARNE